MIFKTFNSDSDKVISKIGILGKSFEQIGTSIRQRKIEIDNLMGAMSKKDAKNEVGSFWSYVFGNKSIKEQPIDLSTFIELDKSKASDLLKSLQEIDVASKSNTSAWQEYFSAFNEGEKWQIEFVQNNDIQKASIEDLIKANQEARASALDHNEAIKNMTFSAKAGTVAMKALSVAGNMLVMWGITKVLELTVKGIDNIAHSAEHCKERVDELMSSYQSALDEANSNAKTIEGLAARYEELSDGVNNLGRNVSLTTDEYEEYNDICNQIADMFPNLIQGYTDEGTAILSLKGNVEALRDAYKEAQQEAYNLIINNENADDIIKNANNTLYTRYSGTGFQGYNRIEVIDFLNKLIEATASTDDMLDLFNESVYNGHLNLMSDFIYFGDNLTVSELTPEQLVQIKNQAQTLIQTYQTEIDSALQDVQTLANAYLVTNADYANLDENTKNAASIIVNSIDENVANGFKNSIDVGTYVTNIVNTIKDNPEVQDALVNLFQLDISEMNPEDAQKLIDQYISYIANALGRNPLELKAELGFDDIDDVATNYRNILNDVAKKISGATDGDIINQRGNYEKYQEMYNAIDEFAKEHSINTQDEIAYFQNAIEESKYDIDKAFELYLAKMQSILNDDTTTSTISDSVSQIAQQLKPQFDELGSAYTSIFTEDGMDLEIVDNAMLESLRKTFGEIEEEIGVVFDSSLMNEFFDVLTDSTSTVDDVHAAFDDLATAYFYSTDTLSHLNEETAESIKQQLQQMGVVNNEEIVDHYLQLAQAENELLEMHNQLAEAQKNLAESSNTAEYESAKGRINLIYKQIEAYYDEKGATEELRLALFALQMQQSDLNMNSINSSASVAELIRLAETAGLSSEYMDRLVYLQQLFNQYQAATNGNMQSAIYSQIQSVKNSLASGLEVPELELEFDFSSGKDSGADSAGKDAADEYIDAFNDEFDRLKFLRDNGIITEKEYLDQLRILYQKYFGDKEEYLKEYVEYEHEYLSGLKDLYEDVLGGITNLLDDQIDKIEEERDAKIDALEEEQEARKDALEQQKKALDLQIEEIESAIKSKQDVIDGINDEIDAIREANDERKRQIDLQKAQYELERMQNQRTILQYSEDKGMHYVTDTSGVRDAKQDVEDAKTEIEIAAKEKQIALIEDEIELLERRKSILSDQQDDLDNQMDALDDYYKKLIENIEAYYSALIQPIEDYKAKFESIAEIEENAIFLEQLESLGYSVEDILSLNTDSLENFKSNYIGILRDMYDDNTQMIDAIREVSGLEGEFVGYLSQSQPYIDTLTRLDLSSTQSAIDSANSGIHSFADGAVLATTNITTMADTVTNLLEGSKKRAGIISSFDKMAESLLESNYQISEINSGMDELDGKVAECTIRINVETTGNVSLLGGSYLGGTAITGNAHVEGTALASGNWAVQSNEYNALVGELGRELIVRDGRYTTVGDNGAEMVNIKRGDVVFNHEQTESLLKHGRISGRGKAYADGTVGGGKTITPNGNILRPLQDGDTSYDLIKAFEPLVTKILDGEEKIMSNVVFDGQKQITQMLKEITSSTVINNVANNKEIQQPINIQLGDINLTGVQDVNGLARAIKMNLPNAMLQEMHKN